MDSRAVRGEVEQILATIARLGETSKNLSQRLESENPQHPQFSRIKCAFMCFETSLAQAAQYLDHLVCPSDLLSGLEAPVVAPQQMFPFHVAIGPDVTNAILSCDHKVQLTPDYSGASFHKDLTQSFFPSVIGAQPFLFPLLSLEQCNVYFDDIRPLDELDQPRKLQPGFTTAAIFGLSTKLLNAFQSGTAKKAVLVLRASPRKLQRIEQLLDVVRGTAVQVVNLTSSTPPPAATITSARPKLIVCTMKEISERLVTTNDIHHLIFDDVAESDAEFFRCFPFSALVDVSFRGPPRLAEMCPTVKPFRYTARLWMYSRHVSLFDTQVFSLARDIQELFASFPANQNLVMFTTDSRARLQGVNVVTTLDQLEQEVDHLVVVETPSSLVDMRRVIKQSCAKYVTLVCTSNVSRADLANALLQESFRELPYGLRSFVDSLTRSSEPSPAPVAPMQY